MSRARRCGGWAPFGAVLLALIGADAALAVTPFARRSEVGAKAGTVAKADAARQLAAIRFPPGARKVQRDPSIRPLGPAWGGNAPQTRGCRILEQYEAWDSGFWRVPGTPSSVWTWMQHHPPVPTFDAGRWYDSDISWQGKSPPPWGIDFIFKQQRNVVGRTDFVTLWFARGGGTAVRVETEAIRKPPPKPRCGPPTGTY